MRAALLATAVAAVALASPSENAVPNAAVVHAEGASTVRSVRIDYDRDIRPILAARCFTCHGPDVSTRMADLRLDDPHSAKAERNGRAAAILAGDPDASELFRRIEHEDPLERMPPNGPPLSERERDLLWQWIAEGARWSDPWSRRPIEPTEPPSVRDVAWPSDPLDRFVLARLEAVDLAPAQRADAATLLRRASFALTGLPPSPEALDRVLGDPSRERFVAEVDALLASHAFGERWGRHWLDLVRYAETYGHEFDYAIPWAWRYRDAVVAAFNADMPYDRFVRAHIAGDLAADRPAEGVDPVTARTLTGFWWLTQGTHGPVDVAKDEADRIDNQIDVLSKTFLASTIACARCHDHKFDAISQRDYYGLSAHLKRSRRAIVELDPEGRIEAERAAALAARRRVEQAVDAAAPPDADPPSSAGVVFEFASPIPDGFRATGQAFARTVEEVPHLLPKGDVVERGPIGVATSRAAGERFAGTLRSPSFRIEGRRLHQRLRGRGVVRIIVDGYHLDDQNALLFEGHRRSIDSPEAFTTATWALDRYRGHRAHLEWIDEGDGWLEVDWVAMGDDDEPPHDGSPAPVVVEIDAASNAALVAAFNRSPPEPLRVLAIEDGTPWQEHLRKRGVVSAIGEAVEPGVGLDLGLGLGLDLGLGTDLVAGSDRPRPQHPADRRSLADAITDPSHPLTARVMVNRIWHHLLGRGIVESVDDFGALGTPPSDPRLLDHLADRFRRDWSVKSLVRAIVLSSTWAMSTEGDPHGDELDPTNAIPHRAVVRRLDAESLRDAMLAVAGRLDPTIGGPSIPVHLTEFMDGRGRPDTGGPVDGAGRRSIYLEVRRNFPDPFLGSFDLPVPTTTVGRRNRSNVPGQALAMLNAPLVHALADAWGAKVAADDRPVAARVGDMIRSAFGRPAHDDEIAACTAFLAAELEVRGVEGAVDAAAFTALAHVLFGAKEFSFLR